VKETVILGYARTPFARFMGGLHELPAVDLGAAAVEGALERSGVENNAIDYVILGMVVQAGAGQVPSRQAAVKAGLPFSIPSETINKVCASGLRAINLADMMIRAGEADVVIGGGMENMSAVPYYLPSARKGSRMGDSELIDGMIHDGLWCPFHNVHMGVHGSAVPAENGITRSEMDRFALRSHNLAVAAMDKGYFEDEIVAVDVLQKRGAAVSICRDELPRSDTSLQKLAALEPAFEKNGLITPGNAPPISDGAAALVAAEGGKAEEMQLKPLARIIAHASVSLEPRYIATVPYEAAQAALVKAGLKAGDMHLIEVNEAFAAVALTCMKLGCWDENKVNVNGGAVALGHPIGASGARILITLISELRRRGGGYGLATICSGAAQGEATVIRVD